MGCLSDAMQMADIFDTAGDGNQEASEEVLNEEVQGRMNERSKWML